MEQERSNSHLRPWEKAAPHVGQDWPDSYYQPDKMLLIPHSWTTPNYQPRFAKYFEAYSNLEKFDSKVLRERAQEAIEVIAQTRHSIEQTTKRYLSRFEYDGLVPSGHDRRHFFSEEIAYLENTVAFCCFVVFSIKLELSNRKEPNNDISVVEGIREFERQEEEKRAAEEHEFRTRDNGSGI